MPKKFLKNRKMNKQAVKLVWKVRILLWILGWTLEIPQTLEQGKFRRQDHTKDWKGSDKFGSGEGPRQGTRSMCNWNELSTPPQLQSDIQPAGRYTAQTLALQNKIRNKLKKMETGNGNIRHNVTALHWNMGSKLWGKKKLEIEAVINQYKPEFFIITEANLKDTLTDCERNIVGYQMVLPETIKSHKIARIVMLVKDGMRVDRQALYMDQLVSAIWIKISVKGNKPVLLGAIYREHQQIFQPQPNDSHLPARQKERWYTFVDSWKKAAFKSEVIVLGDTNLDYVKWADPDQGHFNMVNRVKEEIETLGFQQVIQGITRSWPGQPYSLVDQCWMNEPSRLIYTRNLVRTFSDHNLIVVCFRTRSRIEDRHEYIKRQRNKMDPEHYKREIAEIDWTELFESNDVEVVNSIFEEKILKILKKLAPLKKFQKRKQSRNWVSEKMKEEMRLRDQLRQKAKASNRQDDWQMYRKCRNKCVKGLRDCKKQFFNDLYTNMENEKTTKNLYRLTGELMDKKDYCTPQQFLKDGRLVRKPVEMANMQMEHFNLKVENLVKNIPVTNRNPLRFLERALQNWDERNTVPIFKFRGVTLDEMKGLIAEMAESTALGHDNLDSIALKTVAPY